MLFGIVIWAASIAIFLGRHNSWPWAILKGTLLNIALWALFLLAVGAGEQGYLPW